MAVVVDVAAIVAAAGAAVGAIITAVMLATRRADREQKNNAAVPPPPAVNFEGPLVEVPRIVVAMAERQESNTALIRDISRRLDELLDIVAPRRRPRG